MCPPKTPKYTPPPATVYATAPEPEEAPKLVDPAKKNPASADIRAKRRGTKALRTDLEIPGTPSTGPKTGLRIPG